MKQNQFNEALNRELAQKIGKEEASLRLRWRENTLTALLRPLPDGKKWVKAPPLILKRLEKIVWKQRQETLRQIQKIGFASAIRQIQFFDKPKPFTLDNGKFPYRLAIPATLIKRLKKESILLKKVSIGLAAERDPELKSRLQFWSKLFSIYPQMGQHTLKQGLGLGNLTRTMPKYLSSVGQKDLVLLLYQYLRKCLPNDIFPYYGARPSRAPKFLCKIIFDLFPEQIAITPHKIRSIILSLE